MVKTFLNGWKHTFSTGLTDLGCSSTVEHEIELDDPTSFKEPYRRRPPGSYEEVREHIKDMLEVELQESLTAPFLKCSSCKDKGRVSTFLY
jgi:hypothetical protein